MGMFDGFNQAKEMFSQVSELQKLQKKLAKKKVTKEVDGITVTMDGTQALKSIEISDALLSDKKALEKKLVNAIESVKSDLQKEIASEMGMG